jgi:DNA-binding winged helix-turn-helix (wHTH) protein
VWGYAMTHGDRSVDVFVRKLRSKLQRRSPGWEYIHTHFGVGYRFDPQPTAPSAQEETVGERSAVAESRAPAQAAAPRPDAAPSGISR